MFLPILSPTAGAILGIVLFIYFIGVLLKDTANKIDVSPPKPTVKKKPVEPPFIDIAYNEIFPYDEVLSAYVEDGKYIAKIQNKKYGRMATIVADSQFYLEMKVRARFIFWYEKAKARGQ